MHSWSARRFGYSDDELSFPLMPTLSVDDSDHTAKAHRECYDKTEREEREKYGFISNNVLIIIFNNAIMFSNITAQAKSTSTSVKTDLYLELAVTRKDILS